MMNVELHTTKASHSANDEKLTPFAQVFVTITKQDHIKLVADARYWAAAHHRAAARLEQMAACLRQQQQESADREAQLLNQIKDLQAKNRDLQQRLFGRKSEQHSKADLKQNEVAKSKKSRGQQAGTKGHGRAMQSELEARVESLSLDSPHCPCCGLQFADFPGTEDSEVLEIDVKAYRRVIQRKHYRPTCQCGAVPGIVTAPPPARLIRRGKYGISVWVTLLLSKFLYCQPTHRLLREMSDLGLSLPAGTIAGGLQALAPLFAPLEREYLTQLRSEGQWHAD